MGDVLLFGLGVVAAASLVLFLAGRPWYTADPATRRRLSAGFVGHGVAAPAAALALVVSGWGWLILDAARGGGVLEPVGIAVQVFLVGMAVALGGCLVIVFWWPGWVAAELRRLAAVIVVAAVGWNIWQAGSGAVPLPEAAVNCLVVVVLGALPLLAIAQVLAGGRAPNPAASRHHGAPSKPASR